MPHADDASSCSAWRPSHDHKPRIQPSDCDESRLAIITPLVRASEMWAGKDLPGTAHVQPALLQRQQPLLAVAGNTHAIIVATTIRAVKPYRSWLAASYRSGSAAGSAADRPLQPDVGCPRTGTPPNPSRATFAAPLPRMGSWNLLR